MFAIAFLALFSLLFLSAPMVAFVVGARVLLRAVVVAVAAVVVFGGCGAFVVVVGGVVFVACVVVDVVSRFWC